MRALGFHYDRIEFETFLIRVHFTSRANTPTAMNTTDKFNFESRANSTPSSAIELPSLPQPTSDFTLQQVFSIFTLLFRERDSKDEITAAFYAISSTGKSVTFKDLKRVCKQLELGFVESDFAVLLSPVVVAKYTRRKSLNSWAEDSGGDGTDEPQFSLDDWTKVLTTINVKMNL
jgi:hypothetical protein